MLRAEKLEGVSSANIKAYRSCSGKTRLYSRQKGSILIGLIVTLVIMSSLSAGMVSLTSTSTFQELFANNNAQAYYAAESGGRYALAVIRNAYATSTTGLSTAFYNKTFVLDGNGGKFQITNFAQDTNNPQTVTFTSTGTVNSGFLQAKRQLKYGVVPANQSGASIFTPPTTIDLTTLPGNVATGSMGFTIVSPGGNQALLVSKDQGSGINAEAYVFAPQASPNPFWVSWVASGGYSSYDLQVKIATGTLSGSNLINPPLDYANGLTFRSINNGGQKQDFLGVSLVRNGTLVPPYSPPTGTWTTWASGLPYVLNATVKYTDNNYYKCIQANNPSSSSNDPSHPAYWTLLTNADKPMIVLWRRDSNKANGDGTWLAYKLLDQTGNDYIVDGSGHIKDWSTLLVRVVEAASVKLTVSSAPLINIGDTITGQGGTGTARVIWKINETTTNGENVVLLLNNINGTFTLPPTIGTYNTDSYRSRDNYVWVFYTDITDHSSNTTPLETTGVNNVRFGQLRDIINWPITDVQDWAGTATAAPYANDTFSLVDWNSNLNQTLLNTEYSGTTIRIMGSGKEAGAIIRTDLFTRPGPYAVSAAFPGEIGIVSLGGANDAFYDDLAYYLRGRSGTGDDGSGGVIQY